jgi:hypothetical protein
MTQKTYRTAQGKIVDLGALQLRNENVRAVGNMPVNARGDLIDSNNRPIDTRNEQVARKYTKQTVSNVNNEKVFSSKNQRDTVAPEAAAVPTPPEDFEDNFVKSEENEPAPTTGLAGAIARARQVKQEPIKTSRQLAQENTIKKI